MTNQPVVDIDNQHPANLIFHKIYIEYNGSSKYSDNEISLWRKPKQRVTWALGLSSFSMPHTILHNNKQGGVIRITLVYLFKRSIFNPYYSSITPSHLFDAVQVTDSNLTSKVYFTETLARARAWKNKTTTTATHLPGSPGNATKRVNQRTAFEYGSDAPKIAPFREDEIIIRITLAWVIDRSFTPIAQ